MGWPWRAVRLLWRRGSGAVQRGRLACSRQVVWVFPGSEGRMMDRRRYRRGARGCVYASDEIGWDCFGDDDDDDDADFWSRRRLTRPAPPSSDQTADTAR